MCRPVSEDPHRCQWNFWSERFLCTALGRSSQNVVATEITLFFWEYNHHAPEYNCHAPEYNCHAPEYNCHAPEYNRHAPEYNRHAPDFNCHAPEYNCHAPEYNCHAIRRIADHKKGSHGSFIYLFLKFHLNLSHFFTFFTFIIFIFLKFVSL